MVLQKAPQKAHQKDRWWVHQTALLMALLMALQRVLLTALHLVPQKAHQMVPQWVLQMVLLMELLKVFQKAQQKAYLKDLQ
jgi:hypothetical protein